MALDKILEKIAISRELKNKASIERDGRQRAALNISNKKYKEAWDAYKINPENNLRPDSTQFDKQYFRDLMNLKKPPKLKYRVYGDTSKGVRRAAEIEENIKKGRPSVHSPKKNTLHGHIKNIKKKKLISRGAKGILAIGGLAGAAYGGKKLYDKVIEKSASLAVPALENLGLGVLAVPSAKTLLDHNASEHDKSHAKYELGGLGILAAHPTYELGAPKLAPHMSNIGTNMMEHTSPMVRRMGQGISNIASKIRFK